MSDLNKTSYTLLERALTNDDEAWKEIQAFYSKFIYYFLHDLNVRSADQEDLAQDILIKLHKELKTYDRAKGRFRTWFRTVIRNKTLMFYRKEEVLQRYGKQYKEQRALFDESSDDVFNEYFDREWENHIIEQALERVKGGFSENALRLVELEKEGLTVNEISEQLEMAPGAVYKMRTRIQKSIVLQARELIKEYE